MKLKIPFNIPLPNYDHLSKSEKKKAELIQIFSFVWIIESIITLTVVFSTNGFDFMNLVGHSMNIVGVSFILILLYKKKFKTASILFVALILVTIFFFSNFITPGNYSEYYYLFVAPLVLVFSNNKIIIYISFLVSYIAFIMPNIFFDVYDQYQESYFALILFAINFIMVYYFKSINDKSEKLLEIKTQELEELNQFQSQFFINISHEIRTPLTLLKGQVDKIDNLEDPAIVQEKMNHQINKIKNIVDDVIDLSKMSNNLFELNKEIINLNNLAAKIQISFESLFTQKNIKFNFTNTEKNCFIKGDPLYLERVFNNLILNAYKYTDKNGEVKIILTEKEGKAYFTVSDTGIGIDKRNLSRIFNRFYQVNNDYNKTGGSGIGLAFSKEIINLLNGEITVKSQPNIGSEFTVCFPLVYHVNENIKQINEISNYKGVNVKIISNRFNHNILIVEDSFEMRAYLKEILFDYNCFEAENGIEALEILTNEKIDFVVTDYMMPKMNGYELIAKMKKHKFQIPVLMLTAIGDYKNKLDVLQLGIDDYLTKPFEKDELLIRINNILKNNKERNNFILNENIEEKEIIKNTKYTNELKEYIIKNCDDIKLTQIEIAEHFNISKSTFYRKVKMESGLTPKEFIIEVKLLEARNIVEKNKSISLKELSLKVGFLHPTHFANQYKKRFGIHPITKECN